jgi:Cys-tRNA(Pro)/Cys-tRNA(Cys) deacylase
VSTSRASSSGPSTPATVALTALGIAFVGHPYEHRDTATDYGAEASAALGVSDDRVLKTLMVEADGALVVAVVPVSRRLDLKALATEVAAKKAVLAAPALAERRTGYVVGGISPLGQRTSATTVIDATAASFATVFVSGGRRGFDVEIAPDDLVRATRGRYAAVARD